MDTFILNLSRLMPAIHFCASMTSAMPPKKSSSDSKTAASAGTRRTPPPKSPAAEPRRRSQSTEIGFEQLFNALKSAGASGKPLLPALEEQGISPPIVLIEENGFRSRRLIEWIKVSLFGGRPDSIITAFGSEVGSAAASDSLSSTLTAYSLLAPTQLVAIFDADKIKAAHAAKLAAALERGRTVNLAVLTAAEAEKGPLLKEISGIGTKVSIAELAGPALLKWISGEVQRHSAERSGGAGAAGISPGAAQHLARLFGGDLADLAHEIEKLVLLTDRGGTIDETLVRSITIRESEHNSFELFHRIARQDIAGAAALVELLINQGFHPLQISSFLSKAVRTAIASKDSPNRGGADKLHGDISNPWFARNLGSSLGALKPETLRSFVSTLKKLDGELKGSKLPPELVTSLAATRMAARR